MELRELALIAYRERLVEIAEKEERALLERQAWMRKACMSFFGVEADSIEGDRLTVDGITLVYHMAYVDNSLHLWGTCPRCGAECMDSRRLQSLEQLGEALTKFDPASGSHECVPVERQAEPTWGERLVALLDERYEADAYCD